MPYYKNKGKPYKKTYKKRSYGGKGPSKTFYKKKSLSARTNMVRAPFGNQMYTQVTYSANFTLQQASVAVPIRRVFMVNSAYDPDVTLGGDSSRFFTTLCGANETTAPYNEYRVLAVKATLVCFNKENDGFPTNGNSLVGLRFRTENQTGNDTLDEMLTSRNASYKYLGASSGNRGVVKIKAYKKMSDILGVKDLKDVDGTKALYNANPVGDYRVYIDIENCSVADTGISNVSYILKLKQYIQFLTPNKIVSNES